MQALKLHGKHYLQVFCMMESLVFGLRIITSAYYSLWKWNHLQTNHLSMRSKTIHI